MKTKEFLLLFVPPIFFRLKKSLFPKQEIDYCSIPKINRSGDKMIVIGNGPSLNKSIELYGDIISQTTCMMVNESCMTPLFETIKPAFYFLVDPVYYDDENNKHYVPTRNDVIDSLISKTIWPMSIIMPKYARGCNLVERLRANNNIKVLYYETNWKIPNNLTQYEAWDENLVIPPGQTVLNTAVWLSIYWGYPETYLIGADTSFLADLRVDQETNVLYTVDTHFYSNEEVYKERYDSQKQRRPVRTNLYTELFSIGTALKAYWELRGYADWKGVKVYNASEYSWIDAFERKKLE